MTWFTEDSTPLLVIGVIIEALLVLGIVKTGRVWILYAMAAVALLVGAAVYIEKHTITDTKRVRAALDNAAAALEHNDWRPSSTAFPPRRWLCVTRLPECCGWPSSRACTFRGWWCM